MDPAPEHASRVLANRVAPAWISGFAFAVSDALVGAAMVWLAVYVRDAFFPSLLGMEPFAPVRTYVSLWPLIAGLVSVRLASGLYPGYGLNAADELRRQTTATLVIASVYLAGGALFEFGQDYSRAVLLFAFALVSFVAPPVRSLLRKALVATRLYGVGVWIVGGSHRVKDLTSQLNGNPSLGLRVVGSGSDGEAAPSSCRYALLVPDDVDDVSDSLDSLSRRFQYVWLVPNLLDVASVWVTARDLNGHLALEVRNNLLRPVNQALKRVIDVCFVVVAAPLTLALLGVLVLLVRLDSEGPVFYLHTRIGRHGKPFKMVKFRTMYVDADERLKCHLEESPEAAEEWSRNGKLRSDPRATALGRFLRRYSIDELPQIWNILKGQMSLVGPRAITRGELRAYGYRKQLYLMVPPGLTGLWQVSGGNRLTYSERARLDTYYVRNWSFWLDLTIIARTLGVVLNGRDGQR